MPGQNTPINTFTQIPLRAFVHPEKALRTVMNVNLPPSVTIAKGNLLLAPSSTGVSAQQTLAITGSPTGGTFTLNITSPLTGLTATTGTIPYTFGDSAIQNAINALFYAQLGGLGPGAVTVASGVVTFTGALANLPVPPITLGTNSLTGGSSPTVTVASGTTAGVMPGTYTLYSGSGNPVCWLMYDVATDNTGLITYGLANTGGPWGEKLLTVPAYYAGTFLVSDIPNIDANAVTTLKAHLLNAQSLSTAGAVVEIPAA